MEIRPIKTESDYDNALAEIDQLWGAEEGTADGDRLDVLLVLVDSYEARNHPINPPKYKSEAFAAIHETMDAGRISTAY